MCIRDRTAYSLRELKTREDWNEWQANVLGAAILMPQREIDLAVAYYARGRKLISYDGTYAYWEDVYKRQDDDIDGHVIFQKKVADCVYGNL